MIVFDAPVAPEDQTAFVRRVPVPSNLRLSQMFPTVVKSTNKVNFSEITKTNRTARFRAFDGRIHVADRDGASERVINMPALSDSRSTGEYERLQIEAARLGGTSTEPMVNAIYDDSQDLTSYVHNRMELAVGDVLTDGVLTIDDDGYKAETDYGLAAENKPTAATLWTADGAEALTDLIAWCDAYEAVNGFRPGSVLTSRKMVRLVNQNKEVIDAVAGSQTGKTRVSLADAAGTFENEGVPTDWVTYETQLDVDGTSTRVIPDDRVILLPPNLGDLLEIRYGLTATGLELVGDSRASTSFQDAAGIVGVVIKEGPPFRQFTFVDAVGMPVIKDVKKLFVGKAA